MWPSHAIVESSARPSPIKIIPVLPPIRSRLFHHAQEAQKVGLLLQTLAAQAVGDIRAGTLTPANVTASTGAPALSSFLAQIDLPSMPP